VHLYNTCAGTRHTIPTLTNSYGYAVDGAPYVDALPAEAPTTGLKVCAEASGRFHMDAKFFANVRYDGLNEMLVDVVGSGLAGTCPAS